MARESIAIPPPPLEFALPARARPLVNKLAMGDANKLLPGIVVVESFVLENNTDADDVDGIGASICIRQEKVNSQ